MADIMLRWDNETGTADMLVDALTQDLAIDRGLLSAVIVSLFTDARAPADELPTGETDPRGWWADTQTPNDETGSQLWLLDREKQTDEVLGRAEDFCRTALQWIVEDGLAVAVDVQADWIGRGVLSICPVITLPNQERVEYQFEV